MKIIETITKRRSVRTFNNKPLDTDVTAQILNILTDKKNLTGPFGFESRYVMLPSFKKKSDKGIRVGTYGIIKNPESYIAGISQNNNEALVDFGYSFEKIFLKLTHMGIGTCWMGGTFKRDTFNENIEYSETEIIPAVTPIGYPTEKLRFMESGMRKAVKADSKKQWDEIFFDGSFNKSLTKASAEKYEAAFEMVRLGPSASNKQPWVLILSEDKKKVYFYLNFMPKYAGNTGKYEMQRIDIGIAMAHFELASEAENIKGRWVNENPIIKPPHENMLYISTFNIL